MLTFIGGFCCGVIFMILLITGFLIWCYRIGKAKEKKQ